MHLKRLFIFFTIIVLLALLSIYWPQLTGNAIKSSQSSYPKETVFVTRIIDGDTLVASGESLGDDIHIRILGINTPEKKQPYHNEAESFLKQLENLSVELVRDQEDEDKYNRKLRYVYYKDRFINVEILENGLATSYMLSGLKYGSKLSQAENFAKMNNIGLWQKSQDKCALCMNLTELNAEQDYFTIKNVCDFDCQMNSWTVKDDANHITNLEPLGPNEYQTYKSAIKVWNDDGDRFFMRDSSGNLVIFYQYVEK